VITLYGTSGSRANRCLWVLEELGLEYEHAPIGFGADCRSPDYLRINPNGHIPSLDDHGTILWESVAINLYLADKYGADPFWPSNREMRGKCYQWSLWGVNEIEPRVQALMDHRIYNPPERRDPEADNRALGELKGSFRILDDHLRQSEYLVGDAFTVADANVASIARALVLTLKIDLSESPAAREWLSRCLGREGYQRVLRMK